jgi:hypothetical protein
VIFCIISKYSKEEFQKFVEEEKKDNSKTKIEKI